MKKYLTKEGLETLKKELHFLETEKRHEIAERLREAASHGDLSENAAYEAAKEEQGNLEVKVRELKGIISQAEIIAPPQKGKIGVGSTIFLKSKDGENTFTIVGSKEADILKGKLSFESPLGEAVLNKQKGDVVEIETFSGKINYKIVDVK